MPALVRALKTVHDDEWFKVDGIILNQVLRITKSAALFKLCVSQRRQDSVDLDTSFSSASAISSSACIAHTFCNTANLLLAMEEVMKDSYVEMAEDSYIERSLLFIAENMICTMHYRTSQPT